MCFATNLLILILGSCHYFCVQTKNSTERSATAKHLNEQNSVVHAKVRTFSKYTRRKMQEEIAKFFIILFSIYVFFSRVIIVAWRVAPLCGLNAHFVVRTAVLSSPMALLQCFAVTKGLAFTTNFFFLTAVVNETAPCKLQTLEKKC